MVTSSDELLEFLLERVALTGRKGVTEADLKGFLHEFNAHKNSDSTVGGDESLGANQNIEEQSQETVLHQLTLHPSICVKDDDDDPSSAGGIRIHATNECMWRAIAGHAEDYVKIPRLEFDLLCIIAAHGNAGIPQPTLRALSGQDKRSVPKRTDVLAEKGYILKVPTLYAGINTSLCTLRKFVKAGAGVQNEDHAAGNKINDLSVIECEPNVQDLDPIVDDAQKPGRIEPGTFLIDGSAYPQWSPDYPFNNVIYDAVHASGIKGITKNDLIKVSFGPPWRRLAERIIARLTNTLGESQPYHLRHLSIVRDIALTDNASRHIYRSYFNHQLAVDTGEASWGAVRALDYPEADALRNPGKANEGSKRDIWGFPQVSPDVLFFPDGSATLSQCANSVRGYKEKQRVRTRTHKVLPPNQRNVRQMSSQSSQESEGPQRTTRAPHGELQLFNSNERTPAGRYRQKWMASWEQWVQKRALEIVRNQFEDVEVIEEINEGRGCIIPDFKNSSSDVKLLEITAPDDESANSSRLASQEFSAERPLKRRRIIVEGAEPAIHSQSSDSLLSIPNLGVENTGNQMQDEIQRTAQTNLVTNEPIQKQSRKRAAPSSEEDLRPNKTPKATRISEAPADRFDNLVNEVRETLLFMKRPGAYINPPSVFRAPQRGRPRLTIIVVIVSNKLQDLEWFKHSMSPKASGEKLVKSRANILFNFGTSNFSSAAAGSEDSNVAVEEVASNLRQSHQMLNDVSVGQGSPRAEPSLMPIRSEKKRIVIGGGSVARKRTKIITDILDQAGGAYPGGEELWYPFVTAWNRQESNNNQHPQKATVARTVKAMVDSGKVRRFIFSFESKSGLTVQKQILAKVGMERDTDAVKLLETSIIEAYPRIYLPDNVDVSNDLIKARSKVIYGKTRKLNELTTDKERITGVLGASDTLQGLNDHQQTETTAHARLSQTWNREEEAAPSLHLITPRKSQFINSGPDSFQNKRQNVPGLSTCARFVPESPSAVRPERLNHKIASKNKDNTETTERPILPNNISMPVASRVSEAYGVNLGNTPFSTSGAKRSLILERSPRSRRRDRPNIGKIRRPGKNASLDMQPFHSLIVAVSVVKILTGGLERTTDWKLVKKILNDEADPLALRSRHSYHHRTYSSYIKRLESAIQDCFLQAYENGEIPEMDFDTLYDYNWDVLLDWAKNLVSVGPDEGNMTNCRDRASLEENFLISEQSSYEPPLDDLYAQLMSTARREEIKAECSFSIPLRPARNSDNSNKQPNTYGSIGVVESHVRANILTPQSAYNPVAARNKLRPFGERILDETIQQMVAAEVLRQKTKGENNPSRDYVIPDRSLHPLNRAAEAVPALQAAVCYEQSLLQESVPNEWTELSFHVKDGEMIPTLDLIANNQLDIDIILPEISESEIEPGGDSKLSIWGFTVGNYKTTQIDRSELLFDLLVSFRDGYHDSSSVELLPPPGPHIGHPGEPIPIWYDIHDYLLPQMWISTLSVIVTMLVQRPGTTAASVEKKCKPCIAAWEAELILDWLSRMGVARKLGDGWMALPGWWKVFGSGQDRIREDGSDVIATPSLQR